MTSAYAYLRGFPIKTARTKPRGSKHLFVIRHYIIVNPQWKPFQAWT